MGNTRLIRALMAVLLLLIFAFSSSMESTTNISSDQLALLALKSRVNGDLLATNWSTVTSICNWIGVTCGSRHHRVTALNLNYMGLFGTIPPHLGNLSFLVWLHIRNNSFYGSLPVELANLRRLKSIELANNNFGGEIPSWLGSFTKLVNLSLSDNNFMGVIPSSLSYLSKLELLSLFNNNLQGLIPASIGNLSSLRLLYLVGNQLSGSIPPSIFNLSSLREVYLGANWLLGSIPSMPINMSSSLQIINLEFNNLTGHFPTDLCDHLPQLQVLSLSYNLLSGRIPECLSKCKQLRMLSLSFNRFEGRVPKEIGNLTMLKFMYLGRNNLKGEIPREVGNLLSLEKLSITNCQLTGPIPPTIGNLTVLNMLSFSDNNLTGTIPPQIGNLANLERLYLGANSISGLIPPRIFNSSIRRTITLSLNSLSGHLPSSTGLRLPKLEELLLGGNELNGPVPSYISNASQLTMLDIGSNSFSGYIPIDLGNLRYLEVLVLERNNLSSRPSSPGISFLSSLTDCKYLRFLAVGRNPLIGGELPISFGNLSISLQVLKAFGANIKGKIPAEIGNLSNLIDLNLDNNGLIRSIPTTIGRLRKLQSLSLQDNKLEGSIPPELCHLNSLAFLYLIGNKLGGPIPACLGDLISLRYLLLGSNKFVNSIPSTLTRLVDILELNLSSNSITGALPVDIGKLMVVTVIDFSGNQLSGKIPNSIGNLKDLTYLLLSGNKLHGSIPEFFGDLIGLQFLDLSRNDFSSNIPKSLQKLLYLKYFNVSFNRLQGEIPTGGPFANYSVQSFMGNKALCGAPRLQVPTCKIKSARHSKKATNFLKYILPPVGSTILVVLALIVMFLRSQNRNSKLPTDEENLEALAEWRRISYQELCHATNGFCETKLLGEGSFGSVYHGTLSDGLSIAVKVFNLQLEGAFKSFGIECEVLCNIRHRNLVKIISSCCNVDFKALVLEFMPNGSLDKWLYSHNYFLDILHRLNIMIDVASALEYLHHGQTIPTAHCDLKPSNVLLDEDMVAHLGDFGIAKLLGEEDSTIQTMTLATIGYMAPEYGSEGIVSIKGDVYSFGILLMETFTRKKPTDEMFTEKMSLRYWVNESLPSSLIQVLDTNLLSNDREREQFATMDCAFSVLQLALECSMEIAEERIDIKDVVAKLKKMKIKFLKDVNRQT